MTGFLVAASGLAVFAAVASEVMDDPVVIGELFVGPGRPEPRGWVPITRSRGAEQPHPRETESWRDGGTTLWVGVASFRDSRCGATLFNLFSKADYPERVTAGVVQQNIKGDEECLSTYCSLWEEKKGRKDCPFLVNIRVLKLDASDAQGPCWGRHYQSYLLAEEEFCMQIDSHMDFVDGWDTAMMAEWAATDNEYGVLSTYVQGFENLGINVGKRWEVAHLCEVSFPSNQPRNQPARAIHGMVEPKLTTTWGAGFSFSKCHAERAVPYDPYLYQIFDGEEFSKMLRLWTNGYDVYTPRRSHLVHDYSHPDQKTTTSWRSNSDGNGDSENRKTSANQRLWDLMEMPRSTEWGRREVQGGPWGLGDRRTLDEFIEFTGVDLRKMKHVGVTGDRCGSGVEWVPYALDDGIEGGGGDGNTKPFRSWKKKNAVDPITAGPHWADVERKLRESGVEMWWGPRPNEAKKDDAAETRDAPALGGVLERPPETEGEEEEGKAEEGRRGRKERGKGSAPRADGGDGDGDDAGDGDGDDHDVGVDGGAGAGGGGAGGSEKNRGSQGRVYDGSEGIGSEMSEQAAEAATAAAAAASAGDREPVAVEAAMRAAAEAAAAAEGGGTSWANPLLALLSIVGVGCVACRGRRKRGKRKGAAKRRKQVMEWSANAFSTKTLSPLGSEKKATAGSFGWTGVTRSKDHVV